MKCPVCSSQKFYVKDPEDQYETYSFSFQDGAVRFDPDKGASSDTPAVSSDTETFCNQCAWHGKLNALDNI